MARFARPDPVIGILRAAADRMDGGRWCQGELTSYRDATGQYPAGDDDSQVCLVGALNWSLTGHPYDHPPEDDTTATQVFDVVGGWCDRVLAREGKRHRGSSLYAFNDDEARTSRQVIKGLRVLADMIELAG